MGFGEVCQALSALPPGIPALPTNLPTVTATPTIFQNLCKNHAGCPGDMSHTILEQ